MFGEHESESPRVPSPWDHFLPNESSVDSAKQISRSVPKLVPEAEEVCLILCSDVPLSE